MQAARCGHPGGCGRWGWLLLLLLATGLAVGGCSGGKTGGETTSLPSGPYLEGPAPIRPGTPRPDVGDAAVTLQLAVTADTGGHLEGCG
jgi:hypothetical protein